MEDEELEARILDKVFLNEERRQAERERAEALARDLLNYFYSDLAGVYDQVKLVPSRRIKDDNEASLAVRKGRFSYIVSIRPLPPGHHRTTEADATAATEPKEGRR